MNGDESLDRRQACPEPNDRRRACLTHHKDVDHARNH
jgi:hypothetical protein